ncbi:MAG: hypothetical protein LBG52_06875 [Candidatus Peribacteria bacterium]|nr:hypothetical protein [Candidatus Peribacteria bacterium]
MGNRGTKWFAIIGGGAMTMAQLHAETERTRITFDTLAKSIGGTASDALETMRTATR